MDDVPHLALPLRVIGSSFSTVQQDTVDELTMTVLAICSFPVGSRIERPEFGVLGHELEDEPLDLTDIELAVETYEPRAAVTVRERPGSEPLMARVRVEVSMARAQEEELS